MSDVEDVFGHGREWVPIPYDDPMFGKECQEMDMKEVKKQADEHQARLQRILDALPTLKREELEELKNFLIELNKKNLACPKS